MNTKFEKDKIGLGKRKQATARVFLTPGSGNIIINKVSGVPPPKITREVEEKFRQMFKEAQEPFTIYCPKNRKNVSLELNIHY